MRSPTVLEPETNETALASSEAGAISRADPAIAFEPEPERWPWFPSAFAIVLFTTATVLGVVWDPAPGQASRALGLYWLTVMFVSWISGWRWGVAVMFAGLVASLGFFTSPLGVASPQTTTAILTRHFWYLVLSLPFAAGLGSIRHIRSKAARATAYARLKQAELDLVSEAKREAEDTARETTDRMFHLLDRIAESMVIFDSNWRISYSNERAGTMLGVAPDWSERETPWELLPGGQGLREHLEEAWTTGLPSRFELSDAATERWIEYRAYPTPEGMTLFAHDVSEQRLARAALEDSEERYRAFISQSTEAIWRFELSEPVSTALPPEQQIDAFYEHAVLAECNDTMAKLYGYSEASELLGAKLADMLPREEPRNVEYLNAFIEAGYRLDAAESYERDRNGQAKVFLNNLLGIVENGLLIRAWGTQRDITEQKRHEREIREMNVELERRVEERTQELSLANQELSAFCYSVSHDLRAPLRSVMAQSVILQEDYGDKLDEEGKDSLKRLGKAARNMGQLIDDLLALSRIQRAEVVKEPVDLGEISETVAGELASRGCEGVAFSISKPLPANADPRLIQVVITNLLDNACKFASKGEAPRVEVGSTASGEFYVRDNGVGFDSKYADKIFMPFERLHRADEYPGTGIGLANVQRVVERHGGRVWAQGELGKGATFFFTLP